MKYKLPPLPASVSKFQFGDEDYETTPALDGTPRLLIVGHGRHGKDEVAAVLHGRGRFKYCGSTSWQVLPFIAAHIGIPEQVAWETRHENRQYWKDYCDIFRKDDPSRLVKLALRNGNIVGGIRDKVEIEDAVKLFDEVLWVDRPGFPDDPTVTFNPADYATDAIVNEGTLEQLHEKALAWANSRGWL